MDTPGTPPDPLDEAIELMERIAAAADDDDTGELQIARSLSR